MPTLAAKVAPQRSTQYAALASALAEPELRLSPLGPAIGALRPVTLAGQAYLLIDLAGPPSPEAMRALGEMGATSEFFWFHEAVGGVPGPFLQPIAPENEFRLPAEMVEARRYRGKTNELFSQVLINVARWAHPGTPARLLDPLMGGGTIPFIALRLGLDAIGIEHERPAVESTDTFLAGFLGEAGIRHQRKAERVTRGRRFLFTIEPDAAGRPLRAAFIHGDTADAPALLAQLPGGARVDLVAADLPYGIQHAGQLEGLLAPALPAWHRVAADEAVLALAWDATRIPREALAGLVETGQRWEILRGGAWKCLAHPVDRVIKRRDVIVARRRDEVTPA